MNRIILLIGFIPISALIGKILAQKYTDKRIFLEDFLFFLTLLENEVNFSQNDLFVVIEKLPKRDFYKYALNELNLSNQKSKFVTNKEEPFYNKFFLSLGKIDKYSQKDSIEELKSHLKIFYDTAKKTEETNASLYFKLGILIGIMIFILLI